MIGGRCLSVAYSKGHTGFGVTRLGHHTGVGPEAPKNTGESSAIGEALLWLRAEALDTGSKRWKFGMPLSMQPAWLLDCGQWSPQVQRGARFQGPGSQSAGMWSAQFDVDTCIWAYLGAAGDVSEHSLRSAAPPPPIEQPANMEFDLCRRCGEFSR